MNSNLQILACSGPGAMAAIHQSITIGYFCAALGGVVTLALGYDFLRTGKKRFPLSIAGFLLLIHPAWTVSAIHGDCGFLKRNISYGFTGLFVALLVIQVVLAKRGGS